MKKQVHSLQSTVHNNRVSRIAYPVSRISHLTSGIRHLVSGISLLVILSACSPTKRLERFLIRHPEFRHPDTLILHDTITTLPVEADSSIHIERLYDTVVIEKERLEVSLLRIRDTLYVNGKCNPDTIYTENRIPVEKIKLVKESFTLKAIKGPIWLLITLFILIIIMTIIKRI